MCRLVCSLSPALNLCMLSSARSPGGSAAYSALARHRQLVLATSSRA